MLAWTMWLMGVVLVLMALAEPDVQRLPLSASLIYVLIGWAVASAAGPLLEFDPRAHAPLLQVLTEWAVLISLFAVGLRLGAPSGPRSWRVAALLATVGMVVTIALATACAHWLLGLDWPAALLLAAILAPTDPVLASEVQLRSVTDRDAARLALTAEGGMNDGTAWPVVILALGLLGLHDLGPAATQWLLRDLLWLIGGGLVLGWIGGRAVALALRARLHVGHALVWDELLYLGTIALSYGAASVLKVSAFLAVFAAGCALFHETVRQRRLEPENALRRDDLSRRLIAFGGRCERLVEVTMVIFIGAALTRVQWRWELVAFAVALRVRRAPAVGVRGGAARHAAEHAAAPDRLVRDSRRRLGLLPLLCAGARGRRGAGARPGVGRGALHRGLRAAARRVGDALDELVPAAARRRGVRVSEGSEASTAHGRAPAGRRRPRPAL